MISSCLVRGGGPETRRAIRISRRSNASCDTSLLLVKMASVGDPNDSSLGLFPLLLLESLCRVNNDSAGPWIVIGSSFMAVWCLAEPYVLLFEWLLLLML